MRSLWCVAMANATTSGGVASGSSGTFDPREPRDPRELGDLGFDQILARLREVVIRLESGELSLEQSLVIYEEGVQLARRGQHLLSSAEKRVEILISASGGIEVAPFVDPGSPGSPASPSSGAEPPP
jgi:exodeoxyribonuclease VII small subunit